MSIGPLAGSAAGLLALAALAAGCGSESPAGSGSERRFAGDTSQHHRIVVAVQDGEALVRTTASCSDEPGDGWNALATRAFRAPLGPDGGFTVDTRVVHDGGDDDSRIRLWISGTLGADEASGTLRAQADLYDGQAEGVTQSCETGTVHWTAVDVGAPPAGYDVEVEPVIAMFPGAGDNAVWLFTATGQLVPFREGRLGEPVLAGPPGSTYTPGRAAMGDGRVWVVEEKAGAPAALIGTELASGRPTRIDTEVVGLALGGGGLWALTRTGGEPPLTLHRLHPVTGAVEAEAPVRSGGQLFVAHGLVWLAGHGGELTGYDPVTLEAARLVSGLPRQVADLDASRTGLWVLGGDEGWDSVVHVDLHTGERWQVGVRGSDLAGHGDSVWVAEPGQRAVRRVEAGRVAQTVDIPEAPVAVTVTGDGSVWVLSASPRVDADHQLVEVDHTLMELTTAASKATGYRNELAGGLRAVRASK